MNILIVTGLYPLHPGQFKENANLAIHYYAREWARDHNVYVIRTISQRPIQGMLSLFQSPFRVDGVRVKRFWIIRIFEEYVFLRPLIRLGLRKKPDLVIGHLPLGVLAAEQISKRLKVPFVAGFHITDANRISKSKRFEQRYRNVVRDAGLIAFRSKMIQDRFLKFDDRLMQKSFMMPGGISPDWLNPETLLPVDKSGLELVTICELIKRKNVDKVIAALELVKKEIGFSYEIVGSGKERDHLQRKVDELEMNDHIRFHGHLTHQDIRQILKPGMVMVLVSESETFGLVYLEAMARGCIVVGTRGEGIDGVLEDGVNGFLVDPDAKDLAVLLKSINALSLEKRRQICQNAYLTARQYTYPQLAGDYLRKVSKHFPKLKSLPE